MPHRHHLTPSGRKQVEALRERAKELGIPWPVPDSMLSMLTDALPPNVEHEIGQFTKDALRAERIRIAYLRQLLQLAEQDSRFRH
jgi:hypothetical protein